MYYNINIFQTAEYWRLQTDNSQRQVVLRLESQRNCHATLDTHTLETQMSFVNHLAVGTDLLPAPSLVRIVLLF